MSHDTASMYCFEKGAFYFVVFVFDVSLYSLLTLMTLACQSDIAAVQNGIDEKSMIESY